MIRRTIVMMIGVLVLPAMLLAQGTSPLKVTAISVSPASIAPGTNAAISVTIHNTSTRAYGCPGAVVYVYVFKDQPYLSANQVFSATQSVTTFAAGETRTVAIATHWTVPTGDPSSYHVVAWSPFCAPDEFGQTAQLTLRRSCSYSATPLLIPTTKIPLPITRH